MCDRNLLQETYRIINWRLLIYYIKYSEVGHLMNDRESFQHSKQNKFHDFVFPEQQTKAFPFLHWSKSVFFYIFYFLAVNRRVLLGSICSRRRHPSFRRDENVAEVRYWENLFGHATEKLSCNNPLQHINFCNGKYFKYFR